MAQLNQSRQFKKYHENKKMLQSLIDRDVTCMAHPLNSYSETTKKLLTELGISLGFRSNPLKIKTPHPLEVGRIDHVQLLKQLEV